MQIKSHMKFRIYMLHFIILLLALHHVNIRITASANSYSKPFESEDYIILVLFFLSSCQDVYHYKSKSYLQGCNNAGWPWQGEQSREVSVIALRIEFHGNVIFKDLSILQSSCQTPGSETRKSPQHQRFGSSAGCIYGKSEWGRTPVVWVANEILSTPANTQNMNLHVEQMHVNYHLVSRVPLWLIFHVCGQDALILCHFNPDLNSDGKEVDV